MGRLTTRLDRLEQRRPRPDICPEHLPDPLAPRRVDYRDALRAFSPDDDERAAYEAEQDALEAQPPCPRCGWREGVPFRIRVRPDWGPADDEGGSPCG